MKTTSFVIVLASAGFFHEAQCGQTAVDLGSASPFGVLAGSTVTSVPVTTINGDLGVFPGATVTGGPIVNGTTHLGDPIAAQAQADLTTAYNDAAGRTGGAVVLAGNLGGLTLAPGLYKSTTSLEISSGDLTLNAAGDPNAVWIFQMASTLITAAGSRVILSMRAQAGNVFWQVGSSATIAGGSVFKGTIMALASIGIGSSATLEGRALARVAAVTLSANAVTVPIRIDSPVLVSAPAVNGPYFDAAAQIVDLPTKTITCPISGNLGNAQFYRLHSNTALTITSITVALGKVIITYN